MNHAGSFRDLVVYRKAKEVSRAIFELSKSFPIAEAWAKRRYEKHFVSKLSDADAEQMETQHWVNEAFDCGYIDSERAEALLAELQQVGRMLNSMMEKSHLFCRKNQEIIREEQNRVPGER